MKKVIALISMILPFSIFGEMPAKETVQVNDTQIQAEKRSATDDIFNEVMQSLPENAKTRLDSIRIEKNASLIKRTTMYENQKTVTGINKLNSNDLSSDLRKKVEKAMEEIDHQQSKRQLQFKESQRKR